MRPLFQMGKTIFTTREFLLDSLVSFQDKECGMNRIESGLNRLSKLAEGDFDSDMITFAMEYGCDFPLTHYDAETFYQRRNEGDPRASLTSDIGAALRHLDEIVPDGDFTISKKGGEVSIIITASHPQGEVVMETAVGLNGDDRRKSRQLSLAVGRAVVASCWQYRELEQREFRDTDPGM